MAGSELTIRPSALPARSFWGLLMTLPSGLFFIPLHVNFLYHPRDLPSCGHDVLMFYHIMIQKTGSSHLLPQLLVNGHCEGWHVLGISEGDKEESLT